MDALELVYEYFEDRARAGALIRRYRPLALGLAALLLGATSLFTAQALSGRLTFLSFSWPSLALALLWQAAAVFLGAAVLHLVLEMSGARGDAGVLFVHLGLSELAWTAAVPAVLLAQALTPSAWGPRLVFAATGLWSLTLKARGIRDEYGVGGGRAWLTLLLPYLGAAAFAALAAALALAGLVLQFLRS